MSYIVENDFDFYEQLFYELCDKDLKQDKQEDNICLLTYEKLCDNFIILNCNHKFNYIPLYNEIFKQKTVYNHLETKHLTIGQIKCPYCREITNGLLPYIKHENTILKRGVNYPSKYCLKINNCNWIYSSGKYKNKRCNKSAYILDGNIYCSCHHAQFNKKQEKILNSHVINSSWGEKEENISKKYNLVKLKAILKENNLKLGGNKKELILRITNNNIDILL